jgi:Putative zinc-finger
VTCADVRERLPERALGVLDAREAAEVDRHVQWCAACRKESGELTDAAAVLAFAAAPAEPAPELEDLVVELVQGQTGRAGTGHAAGRRGRLAVAAVVAAMVAVSGLGWGAVMAGKAARSAQQATEYGLQRSAAEARYVRYIDNLEFADPRSEVFIGTLAPGADGIGGGSAFTLVSPDYIDMAVVMVDGLPTAKPAALPYTVYLRSPTHRALSVGKITSLDSGGGAMLSQQFDRDLAVYRRVAVVDANGHLLLGGALATRAPLSSPSP